MDRELTEEEYFASMLEDEISAQELLYVDWAEVYSHPKYERTAINFYAYDDSNRMMVIRVSLEELEYILHYRDERV
jgi:hypothetical protein